MAPLATFRYEFDDGAADLHGNRVTSVKCQGKLVMENASQIKEVVKPLLLGGGRVVVDLGGLTFLDSSGLGALVSLKASAANQRDCKLEYVNMTPKVLDLLQMTRLMDMFAS